MVTQIVNKRDESPTTTTYYTRTTTVVSGDLQNTESSRVEEQPGELGQNKVKAEQTKHSRAACFSSGTISLCSMFSPNATTSTGRLMSTTPNFPRNVFLNSSGSPITFSSTTGVLISTQSFVDSRLVFPGFNSTISLKIVPSSSSTPTVPGSSLAKTTLFLGYSAPHSTNSTRNLQSATASFLSTISSKFVATAQFNSSDASLTTLQSTSSLMAQGSVSPTTAIISSLGASGPTHLGSYSRISPISSPTSLNDPGNTSQVFKSSRSLSQNISIAYSSSITTSLPISSQPTLIISSKVTMSSVIYGASTFLINDISAPLTTPRVTASSIRNAGVAYSARVISSNVAAASGYAVLLKADPSNKSKARAAQKSTHDSLNCTFSPSQAVPTCIVLNIHSCSGSL